MPFDETVLHIIVICYLNGCYFRFGINGVSVVAVAPEEDEDPGGEHVEEQKDAEDDCEYVECFIACFGLFVFFYILILFSCLKHIQLVWGICLDLFIYSSGLEYKIEIGFLCLYQAEKPPATSELRWRIFEVISSYSVQFDM